MTRLEAALAELAAAIREEVRSELADHRGPPELLGIQEASRRLGIGRTAAYDLISGGALRSVKVGRRRLIPADALAELAQRGTVPTANGTALEVDGHGRHSPHRSAA